MLKLQGTITAMVTPFDTHDNVDYGALKAFVDWQCENGVEGICAVGTSGERRRTRCPSARSRSSPDAAQGGKTR